MKIAFINNGYFPTQFGGAERSVQFLAEAMTRLGHDATVFTNSTTGSFERGEVNGIPIVYLQHRNLYSPQNISRNPLVRVAWHLLDSYNPLMGLEVLKWLRAEKPDVVHTNVLGGISVAAWDAAGVCGIPLVHTLREYYLQCRLMTLNRTGVECKTPCAFCRVCAVPRRARSSQPDAVVGISQHVLTSHLEAGFFSGVTMREVIYNSVPAAPTNLSVHPSPKSACLRIGFIGRLERLKGIELLLAELDGMQRPYELRVAGVGQDDYIAELKKRTSGKPVQWLGYMEPREFFSTIDLLVVPSMWQEPFGRVVIESYSYGVPVLASRMGGLTEIVEEGVTGFLFDPDIRGDLRGKLERITPKACMDLAAACVERHRDFEPDRIARQYLDLFQRAKDVRTEVARQEA